MDWRIFFAVWALGVSAVLAQGIASWLDGYLTQAQMTGRGIGNGWSFVEHGGMWADALLVSPVLGLVLSRWKVAYGSPLGIAALAAALVICLGMGYQYQLSGVDAPEAHTHDGRTTVAGLIHGLFAIFAMWTLLLVYMGATSPRITSRMVLVVSCALTPFCVLGVVKFSPRWSFDAPAVYQVVAELTLIWAATCSKVLQERYFG